MHNRVIRLLMPFIIKGENYVVRTSNDSNLSIGNPAVASIASSHWHCALSLPSRIWLRVNYSSNSSLHAATGCIAPTPQHMVLDKEGFYKGCTWMHTGWVWPVTLMYTAWNVLHVSKLSYTVQQMLQLSFPVVYHGKC